MARMMPTPELNKPGSELSSEFSLSFNHYRVYAFYFSLS